MDSFTTGRRASWQSKAPAWPFLIVAFVLAAVGGVLASLYASGVIMGDGTYAQRAYVWIKTASNIVIPALLVGGAVGGLLNFVFLSPARKDGAMKWSGLLMLTAALCAAPMSIARGMEADRLGYEIRLKEAVSDARIAARRSETDFYRRLSLLTRHQGFGVQTLRTPDGLEHARGFVARQKSLLTAARKDYADGQASARAALAGAVVNEADREAVLTRFDEAQVRRTALMDRIWTIHDRLAALNQQEVDLLYANRNNWRPTPYGAVVTNPALFGQLDRIQDERRELAIGHDRIYAEVATLDAETNRGIDRVIEAAAGVTRP